MGDVVDALAPFGPGGAGVGRARRVPRTVARIGEILVANGVVTSSQLDAAVEVHTKYGQAARSSARDLGFLDAPTSWRRSPSKRAAQQPRAAAPPPPPVRNASGCAPETRAIAQAGTMGV